jgi:hypothetical protein
MKDTTEVIRRKMVQEVNGEIQSNDPDPERKSLEAVYGKIWDTKELSKDFNVTGFMAPFVVVRRKSDGKSGSMMFQHHPRFYFNFSEK